MVNQKYRALGNSPSIIRELFMYGLEQAKKVGAENVFDFSLGNPSVPAPDCVNDTIQNLAESFDSVALHGYTSAQGAAVASAKDDAAEGGAYADL